MIDQLPFELLEQIFSLCEDYTLAVITPRVCKLFNRLIGENGNIWKKKCIQKYFRPDDAPKNKEQSWKSYYFMKYIRLFPVYGFYIGRTTLEELQSGANSANAAAPSSHVVFNSLVFAASNQKYFDMMLIPRNTHSMPKNWQELGISWNISYNEAMEFLRKNAEDFFLVEEPRQIMFKGRTYFSAKIAAIITEPLCNQYRITFSFGHTSGDENTPNSLINIAVHAVISE
jgi:hypothetical protein